MSGEERIRVLEFFSGVGGWHMALAASRFRSTVVGAFELNPNANTVYSHNFTMKPRGVNIEKLTAKDLDSYSADMWVMSPPCQPFTRLGKRKDCADERTNACMGLLSQIPELSRLPRYFLLENVQGFEESEMRRRVVEALLGCGYSIEEFLLDPRQVGMPNARLRYYMVAKYVDGGGAERQAAGGGIDAVGPAVIRSEPPPRLADSTGADSAASNMPGCPPAMISGVGDGAARKVATAAAANGTPPRHLLRDMLQTGDTSEYCVPDKVLAQSGGCIDIVFSDSDHTCCFTKAYSQYAKGTGSVLALGTVPSWSASQHADFCRKDVYGAHDTSCLEVPRELDLLRALRLRYFSPREVANLLGFPASFEFPPAITRKQQYKLLGNSVSVPVLIRLLEHAVGIERVTRYHPS